MNRLPLLAIWNNDPQNAAKLNELISDDTFRLAIAVLSELNQVNRLAQAPANNAKEATEQAPFLLGIDTGRQSLLRDLSSLAAAPVNKPTNIKPKYQNA